ncbi:sigma-70 family RNA polymerase sigma factor [Saccharomonospora cyanea]|uniref:RNA polymerase sigma factor, sigma-70 family n=1 Tax=Saccharomonospora cyanea NA-134 TaxID=882082 RepID=H5XIM7_9PSEU|nr:sigma-70 family RNA polymerase sigma factor [Saccharomonospora cyanea]EHR59629.1 RNA polymerase sigma factor, sigma-70 family [Saccharomonospora cyanea NA-134]
MTTDSAGPHDRSDADLIASVRAGRIEEYGALYERHVGAAVRLARQLCPATADADDVVSESFAKVLDALRDGKGPDHAFRAYLLTTVRHTAYSRARAAGRVRPTGDIGSVGRGTVSEFTDPAVEELERSLVARAFQRLPERWQTVLWHTVIEQQPVSEVAPLLGMSPNAVAALAYRARAGLRQEYLQAHLAETSSPRCRATAGKLGAWTRDGLSLRERAQVEQHLDHCARCRALADELADVNASLRGVVAFLVLGGATLGYLAGGRAAPAAAATGTTSTVGASTVETGPRQFLGVAVSGVALATAVAVALAAGGVNSTPVAHRSQAEQPRQPSVSAPVTPSPTTEGPPSQPSLPPLPAPEPRPDSYQPSLPPLPPPPLPPPTPANPATPVEPRPVPPTTEPPAEPEPDPAPGDDAGVAPPPQTVPRPQVSASAPHDGLTVDAGGEATDLDVTVRNDGDVAAEHAAVELTLPAGVSAVAQADDEAGDAEARARAASPVPCPAGEDTVVCTVPGELGPDEAEVLRFRVAASPEAGSGTASGRVTATGASPAHFTVPITVRQDVVDLDVSSVGRFVRVEMRSDGVRAAEASVSLDAPGRVLHTHRLKCDRERRTPHCVSPSPLDPGDTAYLWARIPFTTGTDTVTVTATIGDDTASDTVELVSLPPEPEHERPATGTDEADPAEPAPTTAGPTTAPVSTTLSVPDEEHARSPIGSLLRERRRRRLGRRVRPRRSA